MCEDGTVRALCSVTLGRLITILCWGAYIDYHTTLVCLCRGSSVCKEGTARAVCSVTLGCLYHTTLACPCRRSSVCKDGTGHC